MTTVGSSSPERKSLYLVHLDAAVAAEVHSVAHPIFHVAHCVSADELHQHIAASSPPAVVLVGDVPDATAAAIFRLIRQNCPRSRRILLTDYRDQSVISKCINEGLAQNIIPLPIDPRVLRVAIQPLI